MTDLKYSARPVILLLTLTALAAVSVTMVVSGPFLEGFARPSSSNGYDVKQMVFFYATLPRLAMAALCGGALAASGAIMQQVLRNPLASPTTLGVEAGARLTLAVTTVVAPDLFGFGRDIVALIGSAASTGLVFLLVRRRGFQPVATVVAGLVVGLFCGAIASLLVLVEARQMTGVFLWGSGSLNQQSWVPFDALAMRLGFLLLVLLPFLRPLTLLDLGEESARGLGLPVGRLRAIAIAISTAITAFVVSTVGVIGFVGLVAPGVARLAGPRRFGTRLIWSTAFGALLLLITDSALQLLPAQISDFLPTGAVTAVLGAPILLLLLPRLKMNQGPLPSLAWSKPLRLRAWLVFFGLGLLIAAALFVGRAPTGAWSLYTGPWTTIVIWRLPRIVASGAAGALLSVAGVVLQRLTRNELASPEVLGVSAGALLALALGEVLFGDLGPTAEGAIAIAGAMVVLLSVLAFGRRSGFAPDHMLLAGIAVTALADAFVGVMIAVGDPRAMSLLGWMSGSVGGISFTAALITLVAAFGALVAALMMRRWLELLALGGESAQSLGVSLSRARLGLLLLVATASATATPILGPVTFIGLVAPHIVSMLGVRDVRSVLGAAAGSGAAIMIGADWVARTATFPLELPTGLVAALVGAPALMFLLNRERQGR